jgi:hypothetical protein
LVDSQILPTDIFTRFDRPSRVPHAAASNNDVVAAVIPRDVSRQLVHECHPAGVRHHRLRALERKRDVCVVQCREDGFRRAVTDDVFVVILKVHADCLFVKAFARARQSLKFQNAFPSVVTEINIRSETKLRARHCRHHYVLFAASASRRSHAATHERVDASKPAAVSPSTRVDFNAASE